MDMTDKTIFRFKFPREAVFLVAFMLLPFFSASGEAETELKALEDAVSKANKICIQLEHDAVYKDDKVKVVYDRVKKIEQQLNQAREDLVKELEQVPEIKKAREERKMAYAKLLEARKAAGEGPGGE